MAEPKDRGLLEWLAIVNDLRPLVPEYQAARGDLAQTLAVAEKALTVLVARGVTLDEIADVIVQVGPIVALFVK